MNKFLWNQGQKATSRGGRRETPGNLRRSTCSSASYPGYVDGAKHDRAIAWRLIPRTARENAVRKLPADDGKQHKTGCVASDWRSRATHWKAHAPCISRQVARPEKAPSSPSWNHRPGPRKPATRDAASTVEGKENAEQRGPGTAPKGTKLPSSSAPAPPAALPAHPAAIRRTQRRRSATGAAVGPRQGPPPPHRSAGGRPPPRCGGSSRASPTLAPRPPAPTPRPVGTYSYPPSRRTGRS